MKNEYKSIMLTGNEQASTTAMFVGKELCGITFTTRRPHAFPVGTKFRFRNKFVYYGWTVCSHDSVGERTVVQCGDAHVLYRHHRHAGSTKPICRDVSPKGVIRICKA